MTINKKQKVKKKFSSYLKLKISTVTSIKFVTIIIIFTFTLNLILDIKKQTRPSHFQFVKNLQLRI